MPDVDGTLFWLWSEVDVLGQHRDDGWNLLLGVHVRLRCWRGRLKLVCDFVVDTRQES